MASAPHETSLPTTFALGFSKRRQSCAAERSTARPARASVLLIRKSQPRSLPLLARSNSHRSSHSLAGQRQLAPRYWGGSVARNAFISRSTSASFDPTTQCDALAIRTTCAVGLARSNAVAWAAMAESTPAGTTALIVPCAHVVPRGFRQAIVRRPSSLTRSRQAADRASDLQRRGSCACQAIRSVSRHGPTRSRSGRTS